MDLIESIKTAVEASQEEKKKKTYTVHGHTQGRYGNSSFWTRTGLSKSAAKKLAAEQRSESGGVAEVVEDS